MVNIEKAFDSVSFDFINVTLELFEFGPVYRNCINILLGNSKCKNFNGVTIVSGHVSEQFPIQWGYRQGDPITGNLIYLCIEDLVLSITKLKIQTYQTKMGSSI